MDEIILTDNGKKLLAFMQKNDQILVGKDLIELTSIKGIYPVLNSLKVKGLVCEETPIIRDFTNAKGEIKPKEYKTYALTDKGRNFEIPSDIISK